MRIKSAVKTLAVEWPNGDKDDYLIDCGDVDVLKAWLGEAKELQSAIEKINDAVNVDELYELMTAVITKLLSADDWKKINKRMKRNAVRKESTRNFAAVLQILYAIVPLANEGLNELQKSAQPSN